MISSSAGSSSKMGDDSSSDSSGIISSVRVIIFWFGHSEAIHPNLWHLKHCRELGVVVVHLVFVEISPLAGACDSSFCGLWTTPVGSVPKWSSTAATHWQTLFFKLLLYLLGEVEDIMIWPIRLELDHIVNLLMKYTKKTSNSLLIRLWDASP